MNCYVLILHIAHDFQDFSNLLWYCMNALSLYPVMRDGMMEFDIALAMNCGPWNLH